MVAYMYNYRCLPSSLVALQDWLTEDVPRDWWVRHGIFVHFFHHCLELQ